MSDFRLDGKEGWHRVAENGTFAFFWKEGGNSVKLVHTTAQLWQYVFHGDMTLGQLEEIVDAFAGQLEAEDYQFLIEAGRKITDWIGWADDDLRRYGQVGVSF